MFNTTDKDIVLLIPTLNPDHQLLILLEKMAKLWNGPVLLVDDGSDKECSEIFNKAELLGCVVCHHDVNRGKGRALKTGISESLDRWPELAGIITADGDGQHLPEDIVACANVLRKNEGSLILGCRNFDDEDIPARSVFGNKITRRLMKILCGIKVTDTQTGLRGIPVIFAKVLLNVTGERYDFETNMLLEAKREQIPFSEVTIHTVYIDDNKTSHYNVFRDSFRIYAQLLKFCLSSVVGFCVDIVGFMLFSVLGNYLHAGTYTILFATVLARVLSAFVNYILNHKVVFKSQKKISGSAVRYMILCVGQMLVSAGLVTLVSTALALPTVIIKIIVDTILFFFSFQIQRRWVF